MHHNAATPEVDKRVIDIVDHAVSEIIDELAEGRYSDYWCADGDRYLMVKTPAISSMGVSTVLFTTAPLQKGTAGGLYSPQYRNVQINIPSRFIGQDELQRCVPSAVSQHQDAAKFAKITSRQLTQSERRRGTLVHELVHHLDFSRVGPKYRYKGYDLTDSDETTRYFNDDVEFNAYFQAGASAMWKDFTEEVLAEDRRYRVTAFEELFGANVNDFVRSTVYGYWKEDFFRSLDQELYHHFLKRLAQLYTSAKARLK